MNASSYSLFRWILLGVGAACTASCGGTGQCEAPTEHEADRIVSEEALAEALADLEITLSECVQLCQFDDWWAVHGCSVALGDGSLAPGAAGAPGTGGEAGASGTGEVAISCAVEGAWGACEGRRHATWGERARGLDADPVGRFLADAAANEAASVQSFRCLSRELSRVAGGCSRAPALRRAARQEIRHTRLLERIAAARGCQRPQQTFDRPGQRKLLQLALENAREGCVAETYAGLVALHQAERATDVEIRRAFAIIARDEAEHADLAWALHAELRQELAPAERTELDHALERCLRELELREVDSSRGFFAGVDAETARSHFFELGLPPPETARRLREDLGRALRARLRDLAA